jgi:penicillin amidase
VIPLRKEGQGETLTPGDDTRHEWQGFIPFDHAPYAINPSRGYVSSANQFPADASYPYPMLGKRYFEDYRSRVVNTLLENVTTATPDDMMTMQQNNFNLHAAEILPLLLQALDTKSCLHDDGTPIANVLKQWGYEQHRDSLAPVLFELWYKAFEDLTWDELDSLGIMRPEKWRLIEIVKEYPTHIYFDQIHTANSVETFTDIACSSFISMLQQYRALPEDSGKNWGRYKHSHIPHLARLPGFGVDYVHASGGRNIINAMSAANGPSWRMVVELSSPPKAWVNYPGGQSGDPASPHYRDMLDSFFEGKYYEVSIQKDPASWTPARQINIHPL